MRVVSMERTAHLSRNGEVAKARHRLRVAMRTAKQTLKSGWRTVHAARRLHRDLVMAGLVRI